MSRINPINLNAWILDLAARGPAEVDPGPFLELVRRQLGSRRIHKPCWIGLSDHETWSDEALLELCASLYESFLVQYIPVYVAEAEVRDITGLVIKKIGWTLTDMQRRADPTGHAVFKNIETACITLIEDGIIDIEGSRDRRQPRPRNHTWLRSPRTTGPTLELDQAELARRLAAQSDWKRLRRRMRTKISKHKDELVCLLKRMLEVGHLRFRFGDLVDAAKMECCPGFANDRPIEEIAASGDGGGTPDLRTYEGEIRCAIDREVTQPERRERLQALVTYSLEKWPVTHALPDAKDHGKRHGLSKTTAYEDIHILHRCVQEALTPDSRKYGL